MEDVYANPELYGLRRSHRSARVPASMSLESESESDSGSKRAANRKARNNKSYDSDHKMSSEDDDTDEEDFKWSGRRSRQKSTRGRAKSAARRRSPSPAIATRFSNRGVSAVNYGPDENESDESDFEISDSGDAQSYAQDVPEVPVDSVEAVMDHRPIDEAKQLNDPSLYEDPKNSFEFLIKWQGYSHLRNTWETWTSLQEYKGTRRVENYIRQQVIQDYELRSDPMTTSEDLEAMDIERERQRENYEEYKVVERVVLSDRVMNAEGRMELQYLIKWKRLGYDQCTWEDAAEIAEIAPSQVDSFQDRLTSKIQPSLSANYASNQRPKFVKMTQQPDYINGELRDFQLTGINWMAFLWSRNENGILADEMGLGKTVQTVSFLSWLVHSRKQNGPHIVVVPLSTVPAWQETLDSWAPDLNVVSYMGNSKARDMIRENELYTNPNAANRKPKFNVLLTTYEYILRDRATLGSFKWQFLAVDEAHRLKNSESALYEALKEFKVANRLLITGTPLQNNIQELAALVDFLMPGQLTIDQEINFEQPDEIQEQYIRDLHTRLQPFILRRLKKDVEKSLPSKSERILRVELSDMQTDYYKNILARNYSALNAGAAGGQQMSLLNVMVELKKASNHPYLFPNAENQFNSALPGERRSREDVLKGMIMNSGKMVLLDKLLGRLKRDGHRVLVFSQMVRMLDILADYMQIKGYAYQRLDGTVPAATRRVAIDHFNAPDSPDFVFLLSTRAGGLGINLMTADTVIIFDSDWNPQADLQAMARAHRIGQKKHVSVYRFVSKDTVEEQVLERARRKMILEYAIISLGITDKSTSASKSDPSTSELSEILKFGAGNMFQAKNNQKKLEDLNLDDVLNHAEDHVTAPDLGESHLGGEEFLKQFEVTDYKTDLTWDDIIPEDELKKIKEEEKKRTDQEFLKEQIEMSQRRRAAVRADQNLDIGGDEDPDDDSKKKGRKSATTTLTNKPLNEKEIRALYRAVMRFGDVDSMWNKLFNENHLPSRNPELIKSAWADMIAQAKASVEAEMARRAAEEAAIAEAASKDAANGTSTPIKREPRRAVLFTFRGVKSLNAEFLLQRPQDMKLIRESVPQSDLNWLLEKPVKPVVDWSCTWGIKEDSKLLMGVRRYGYGSWTLIRDDPLLKLGDKFFLDAKEDKDDALSDAKPKAKQGDSPPKNEGAKPEAEKAGEERKRKRLPAPGAVHLGRRVDYLITVLRGDIDPRQSAAATAQTTRKRKSEKLDAPKTAESKGESAQKKMRPSKREKAPRDKLPKTKATAKGLDATAKNSNASSPNQPLNAPKPEDDEVEYESMDESACKDFLRPVRQSLKLLKKGNSDGLDRAEYGALIKRELLAVGKYIEKTAEAHPENAKLSKHLWSFARFFWPAPVPSSRLRAMYEKKRSKA